MLNNKFKYLNDFIKIILQTITLNKYKMNLY